MSDVLQSGRRIWLLNVVDTGTCEALAIVVDPSLGGDRVAHELERLVKRHGTPREIVRDKSGVVFQKDMRRMGEGRRGASRVSWRC